MAYASLLAAALLSSVTNFAAAQTCGQTLTACGTGYFYMGDGASCTTCDNDGAECCTGELSSWHVQ